MSSLEERRAARRRRRQDDDAGDARESRVSAMTDAELEARLARRREEREERLARITVGVNAINGEDELERRRRERREARIKQDLPDRSAAPAEEAPRRSRRAEPEETEEEAPAPEPEPELDPEELQRREEEAQKRREEEEKKRQEAEAEAERLRQQEEEDRKRKEKEAEEERKRQEAEAKRKAEEAKKREEEDKKRKEAEEQEELEFEQRERVRKEREEQNRLERLQREEEDKQIQEERKQRLLEEEALRKKKENEQKIIEERENARQERLQPNQQRIEAQDNDIDQHSVSNKHESRLRSSSRSFDTDESHAVLSPVQARLLKFETQKYAKDDEKFEGDAGETAEQRSNRLGRWSVSESHIDGTGSRNDHTNFRVLNRWKFAVGGQKQKEPAHLKRNSLNLHASKHGVEQNSAIGDSPRRSAAVSRLASRFNQMGDGNQEDLRPIVNGHKTESKVAVMLRRDSSQSSDASFDQPDTVIGGAVSHRWRQPDAGSKVTSRWQAPAESNSSHQVSVVTNIPLSAVDASQDQMQHTHKVDSPTDKPIPAMKSWRQSSLPSKEEEAKAEAERLEREREEQEAAMEKKKKKGKRKGLGGLSPEKKKMLKDVIMNRAMEDLENEELEREAEKRRVLAERIKPLPHDFDNMTQAELQKLCKSLHTKMAQLEEELYDWEFKIRKQEFEINELTLKVNDTKGKFIKPVLRKVTKTETKLEKLQKHQKKEDFRQNLKSTGQNKFALDEEPEHHEAEQSAGDQ